MSEIPSENTYVGQLVDGRYRLTALLGAGGSAQVFQADDLRLGRAVAVKTLLPELIGAADATLRLEREGRIAGALSHPNICPVNDLGQLPDGSPYLVMSLLSGESLAARLRRDGPLDIGVSVRIVDQVASGLAAAHEQRFLHRDLKPSNVFLIPLGSDGWLVQLLDFGAAFDRRADTEGEGRLTMAGFVVGTPMYLSPEQVQGRRDFDERTDVYGCGLLLYEMVTGVRAFDGEVGEALLESIALRGPRPAQQLRRDLPVRIAQVIARALARERSARFAGMSELRAALREAIEAPLVVEPRTAATAVIGVLRSSADAFAHDPFAPDPFAPDPFATDPCIADDGATTRTPPGIGEDVPTQPHVPRPPSGSSR